MNKTDQNICLPRGGIFNDNTISREEMFTAYVVIDESTKTDSRTSEHKAITKQTIDEAFMKQPLCDVPINSNELLDTEQKRDRSKTILYKDRSVRIGH